MDILIADTFPEPHRDHLGDRGHTVRYRPGLTGEDLAEALDDADVLVVRSTVVDATAITSAKRLRLIVRAGAGTNTIDVQSAAEQAVYVCNVPGRNAVAVAELTLGLLLGLDRHIPEATADLRDGHWDKARYSTATGIAGRTIGIVGLGAIGRAVAARCVAFDMRVLGLARPSWSAARREALATADIELFDDLPAMLGECDVVTLHVPSTEETRALVDAAFISQLPDSAWIINTSRGDVVDEGALLAALEDRGMRAGLDVFQDEPAAKTGAFASRLAQHPNVIGTHHIGASTTQAQHSTADGVLEVIADFEDGQPRNAVNLATAAIGDCVLVVRHRNEVGVLSGVLDQLREDGINVAQMDNRIFAGASAAVATLRLSRTVRPETLDAIRHVDHVLSAVPSVE
ncbi:NAD(P)-dependent oxidoreductase [Euzebya tangerina]|uniref:NAD(P)-dependent oxidoreductase n=1 Tax=Euzebya tangerina TaxID=591198 RepID=UPI000E30E527|nr:NAD(P)-dependent oxidoreductase [Euzebya tangerina]